MGVFCGFYENRDMTPLEIAIHDRNYAGAQLRKSWIKNNPEKHTAWEKQKQQAQAEIDRLRAGGR